MSRDTICDAETGAKYPLSLADEDGLRKFALAVLAKRSELGFRTRLMRIERKTSFFSTEIRIVVEE